MHNTYISSSISVRSKGSLSFSFSDCSYYLRNERFEKTPISLCQSSYCTCCAYCIQTLPINPSSLLYGLRQSTLIQWSPSRRLVLGGRDQYCNRVPVYDVHKDCYGASCYVEEREAVCGRRGRRVKGRFGCMDSEERSKCRCLGGDIEADVILSLLTEKVVVEECYGVMEKDSGFSKRVQMEKRGNISDQCYRRKKKNVESGYLQSKSKSEFESVTSTTKSRKEGYNRKVENEGSSRGGNHRARTEGSSSSSYYSVSSSGDFESEMEVKVKDGGRVVDSSISHKRDMRRIGEGRAEVEVVEEFGRQRDDKEESGEVSKQQTTAVGSYVGGSNVEWDLRNKSEKKLTEVFIDKKEKLTLAGNLDEATKKHCSQVGSQVIGESTSRINYHQGTEFPTINSSDAPSSSQKQFHGREGNVSSAVNLVQETREVIMKDETTNESKQHDGRLEILNIDVERGSDLQRQPETRRKKQEEKLTLVEEAAKEQLYQTGERSMEQIGSRRNSQKMTDVSYSHDEKSNTSNWQSEARMKNWEESSNLISSSHPEEKEQQFHTDKKYRERGEHRKGSQDVTSTLVVHVSDTMKTDSTTVSEKRMGSQESYLASAMNLVEEPTDGHNQTDEREMKIGSSKEAQRPTKVSSFHESTSEEASSLQASLNLVSQSRVQQVFVQDIDKRGSRAMLIPPPHQMEARGSLHIEGTAGLKTEEACRDTFEKESSSKNVYPQGKAPALLDEVYDGSGRGETYAEPVNLISHEDALGSAARLEKSSMHFVREFVEKVRQEVSSSEIIKQKKLSRTKSEYESEKQMQKGVRYGSEEFQEKEHDSRRSSGVSRTKGPSAEMWDVKESSVQEPPKTETSEGSTTAGNTIVRRSSKSLWSIIADVVRLRWASHSENHTSAVKSSLRSSSNESVSSEAWYSGHEADEDNDENVKREKRIGLQESTSADQRKLGKTPMRSPEESDIMSAKDVISHVRVDTSSSSGILESGSTSIGTYLVPGEDHFNSSRNGKAIQGTPSSPAIVESSLPLSSRHLRRSPALDYFSGTGSDDVCGSGLEQQESPQSVRLPEVSGSEGKDGELTRRKLQRNTQVPKDRFDEWEEAYKHESELRKIDEMFMREALLEAKKAADAWEVPVGAVLVQHGKIVARGFNLVEELRDSTAHAEMICIREASNVLRTWRLAETTLYVTLEPCPMCAGAILQARVDTVVWGAPNKLLGADGSWIRLFPIGDGGNGSELTDKPPPPVHPFHPNMTVRRGVLSSECGDIMQQFFQLRRKKKEKTPDPLTPPSHLHVSNHPSKILTKMHNLFNIMFCL